RRRKEAGRKEMTGAGPCGNHVWWKRFSASWIKSMPARSHDLRYSTTYSRQSRPSSIRRRRLRRPRLAFVSITALVLSTAGLRLGQDKKLQVRDLVGHTDPVYAADYTPDGAFIATASFDKTLKLWDAATRQVVRTYAGHQNLVLSVDISPDGTRIASG